MALSIHTNYAALVTQNSLNKVNSALTISQQRLGTGLRINSAADDAAGLQIATRLNAQSRGMAVAIRNTNDAISMLQTAEGAFQEMTDIVLRMKDLATQAANDTNSDDDRTALQAEFDALVEELQNIRDNTKYAGEALLVGGKLATAGGIKFQIGASSSETITMDIATKLTDLGDDIDDAASFIPPLTTVHQDFAEVGRVCVQAVLDQIAAGEVGRAPAGTTLIPTRLVIRASTAPPRAAR